jgi:hypothetical protein
LILVVCGILALALLWGLFSIQHREPSYQGRTLSQWFDQVPPGSVWTDSDNAPIRAIGTNAIPTILKWISYEPSPLRNEIAMLVGRLSPDLSRRLCIQTQQRADRAVTVFSILGSQTRAAIPELARLALTASDRDRACRCIDSLRHIGPEALPAVLTLATNGPPDASRYAIVTLSGFGTNAAAAVPFLIQCLDDKNTKIADAAEDTLCRFDRSAVFASLINALHSPSAQVRTHAVTCIQWIGTPASEAVPMLEPLLSDPDYNVRRATTNALSRRLPPPDRVRYPFR